MFATAASTDQQLVALSKPLRMPGTRAVDGGADLRYREPVASHSHDGVSHRGKQHSDTAVSGSFHRLMSCFMAMAVRHSSLSTGRSDAVRHRLESLAGGRSLMTSTMERRKSLIAVIISALALGGVAQVLSPRAYAAPAPDVEYLYNVTVRRHYDFPNNDAVGYGYAICDKVSQGESYAQLMGEVKTDARPNDEFAANYLVSYAVNILCPAQIWQLRKTATNYRPPAGEDLSTYY